VINEGEFPVTGLGFAQLVLEVNEHILVSVLDMKLALELGIGIVLQFSIESHFARRVSRHRMLNENGETFDFRVNNLDEFVEVIEVSVWAQVIGREQGVELDFD